jgi:hypothetical protein
MTAKNTTSSRVTSAIRSCRARSAIGLCLSVGGAVDPLGAGGAGVSVFELRDSNDAQDSSGRMDAARGPRCADRTGGPGCPDGAPGQELLEGPLPRKRRQRVAAAVVTTTKTSQAWLVV